MKIVQVHFFADTSEGAYAVVTYLRVYNTCKVSCNFLIRKARLAPIKSMSIPRLELEAATVRKVLGQCLQCKKRNAPVGQLTSKLPKCRLTPNKPPFYFSGMQ